MFDSTAGVCVTSWSRRSFFERDMNYIGTTPSGREVTGRLEVEDGISYIVQVDADGYETWYMVHTGSVRKEVA